MQSNLTFYEMKHTEAAVQTSSTSPLASPPCLEQVVEEGDYSDANLNLEFLLDQDINLDEPLPLLPVEEYNNNTTASAPANNTTTNGNAPTIVPHHHDVLLGRGGRNNQWSGNECLRQLARGMAVAYGSAHKRDKPALALRLVEQVRRLDPPGRFLKQEAAVGHWYAVPEEIAKEKASQCLRDIVAAQRSSLGGNSRKRAYQSAPELNPKRMRVMAPPPMSSMQNATFGEEPLFIGGDNSNPLMTIAPRNNNIMPPKAVSCITLGLPGAPGNAPPQHGNPTTQYNDRLLQQLQFVRAQTQQQHQYLAASAEATATSQQNLLMAHAARTRNVSFSDSFVGQPQQHNSSFVGGAPTMGKFSTANASFPTNASFHNMQQQPQPHLSLSSNGNNSGWATTPSNGNASWGFPTHNPTHAGSGSGMMRSSSSQMPVPTITPSATVVVPGGDDALKRWIDRMTSGEADNNNNGGGGAL